jgi:hypothetical protein
MNHLDRILFGERSQGLVESGETDGTPRADQVRPDLHGHFLSDIGLARHEAPHGTRRQQIRREAFNLPAAAECAHFPPCKI